MKLLKRIGIFLAIIILLLVIISFFLPAKVHVERTAVINAPPEIVFVQVNNLHNWPNWMPWIEYDPDMKMEYFGPAEGTGAGYSWVGDKKTVGSGKLSITESRPHELVATSMSFMEGDPAMGSFKFQPAEGGTKVTWSLDSDMGMNPMNKYFGLFMDQMLGGDFEKGLTKMKNVVESYTSPVIPEINPMPDDTTGAPPASTEKPS